MLGRRLLAVALSVVLLAPGWLGGSGFTVLAGLVPLLWISDSYDGSRRSWWRVFGWALLTFVLWNAATIWWIWFATPVGPVAATISSSTLMMLAFMLFHSVSKKGPKALAYTLLAAGWVATEYWFTNDSFSWPWLLLGNAFSHDIWAIQWYEFTGIFGGTLWVVVANILIFEAWKQRRRALWIWAGATVVVPVAVSLAIFWSYEIPDGKKIVATVVQPNIDPYKKFDGISPREQEHILLSLAAEAPSNVDFIAMPETALHDSVVEREVEHEPAVVRIVELLDEKYPGAMLVTGAETYVYYTSRQTETAREYRGGYYDTYNTALGIEADGRVQIHHKGRLVIGVENTPTWLFKALKFITIDLGGTVGQLGRGEAGPVFVHNGVKVGTAICYEGIYGDFYGQFVRDGAQAMLIVSNDGWWGDTPGYRHLFAFSRIRAVEHRRAIARSANTGMSGLIDSRGDVLQKMGWDERGTLTGEIELNDRKTFYTLYGDYVGRIAQYVMGLCLLYYIAYRVRKKNHLI